MTNVATSNRSPVRIPADIDRPDTFIAGLTARQLAILSVGLLPLWALYSATRHVIPLGVFAIFATPIAALSIVAAVGNFEGLSADRLAVATLRHRRGAKRLVVTPDVDAHPEGRLGDSRSPTADLPSPLRLPFLGIDENGVVDLGGDGAALIGSARCLTFSLRTANEKEALVAGFAGFLNSLAEPVQIVTRAEPVRMEEVTSRVRNDAVNLSNDALARAALGHAEFLAELGKRGDLYVREVLLVLRQPKGPGGACDTARLARRGQEAVSALAGAGVTLTILDCAAVTDCLVRSLDPEYGATRSSPAAQPAHIVTRSTP